VTKEVVAQAIIDLNINPDAVHSLTRD
jgi:hypothetical protein